MSTPIVDSNSIQEALQEVIQSAHIGNNAYLIGGQAILDWHTWISAIGKVPEEMAELLTPRPTSDIDLYMAVQANSEKIKTLHTYLEENWSQQKAAFSYRWNKNLSVTLDLVYTRGVHTKPHENILTLRVGNGKYLSHARVIPKNTIDAKMYVQCTQPHLAALSLHRLSHAGLIVTKMNALCNSIDHLRKYPEIITQNLDHWSSERLVKDVHDLNYLCNPAWIERAFEYDEHFVDTKKAKTIIQENTYRVCSLSSDFLTASVPLLDQKTIATLINSGKLVREFFSGS